MKNVKDTQTGGGAVVNKDVSMTEPSKAEPTKAEPTDKVPVFSKVPKQKPSLKQMRYIENWLSPTSPTFGNSYQSAVAAGFSKSYSRVLGTDSLGLEWVQEAKKQLATFQPEHIYRGFQDIAQNGKQDRDKLKALELMGKARGMFIDRVQTDTRVTFVNDVPRPKTEEVIEVELDVN